MAKNEKTEKIGNVLLDLEYYKGEDLYSEGINEDILLQYVKDYPQEKYDELIFGSRSWSVMYHLSHTRENIVSFLDIKKDAKVLEIGAGCGAVTGALCAMAESVTCIELSKKRSLINAFRHRDASNLAVIVGNFEDIEPHIDEQYDFITLIGVLEYAESYINSDTPYHDILRRIKRHLKPGGKLVIAIENKYGLKYFAGCREDHTGTYFEGIEGYPGTTGVKTFSHDGLNTLLKETGLFGRFYYPYPDYKLCHSIYSDEWLPGIGELNRNIRNFDNDRVICFDETAAFDEIIREGRFCEYSNSFLVIAGNEEVREDGPKDPGKNTEEHIIYAKFSDERSEGYRIATVVSLTENGERTVCKKALSSLADSHIEEMSGHYGHLLEKYGDKGALPVRCHKDAKNGEGGLKRLYFEYADGISMEEYLDRLDSMKRYTEMHSLILRYRDILTEAEKKREAEEDPDGDDAVLKEIFGDMAEGPGASQDVSDVDLIFENIIFDDEKGPEGPWRIIDYEWTFDGRIPVSFIMFRALFYYFRHRENCGFAGWLKDEGIDIYEELGISTEDKEFYTSREESFQLYIKRNTVSFEILHEIMPVSTLNFSNMVKKSLRGKNLRTPQVYLCREEGKGFAPEDIINALGDHNEEDDSITLSIDLDPEIREVRIDPVECECMIKVLNAELINTEITAGTSGKIDRYLMNGYHISDSTFLFEHKDPQLVFFGLPETKKTLRVSYCVSYVDENLSQDLYGMLRKLRKKEQEERRGTIIKRGFNKIKTLVNGPVKTDDDIYPGFICNIRKPV
ncbi:MAG: class I SAM-dependent methyltransferase [Lachnospiraceae bacterium]|nr:class I SAM-dependent methyltransferase [Lachnospiraceae bacterium]